MLQRAVLVFAFLIVGGNAWAITPIRDFWFEMVDTNRDGIVTPAELLEGRTRNFDAMDKNKDGVLTVDDLAGRPALVNMHRILDSDRDGKVTKEQFIGIAKIRFEALDANHDGKVTADGSAAALAPQQAAKP